MLKLSNTFFLIFIFSTLKAIVPIPLNYAEFPLDLLPYVAVYETKQDLPPAQIMELIKKNQLPLKESKASQGFSQSYFWIHFSLQDMQQVDELLIELNNPHIDHTELYVLADSWQKIGYGGDRGRTFSQRSYLNRRYIFPLGRAHNEASFLLMIDKRNASVSFPLKLWQKEVFLAFETKQSIYYGIFFGMLFFMGFVAFIFGILIQKRLLILYGTYAVLMLLYLFTALGFSFQFLYPDSPVINNYSRVLLVVVIACMSTLFSREFLQLDTHTPRISWAFRTINYILIALFFSWLFFMGLFRVYTIWVLNVIYVLLLLIFVLSYCSAFRVRKVYKRHAIVYILAFSSLILGCSLYMAIEYGFIQENRFPLNPVLIGSGVEILILSISMLQWTRDVFKDKSKLMNQHQELESQYALLEENKIILEQKIEHIETMEQSKEQELLFKNGSKLTMKELIYIASDGHYLEFFHINSDKPLIERMSIKEISELLPESFIRIHRSYIINVDFIRQHKAAQVDLEGGIQLPVSRTYKNHMKEKLSNK